MKTSFKNLKEAIKLANDEEAIISVEKKGEKIKTNVKASSAMIVLLLVKLIEDICKGTNLNEDIICEAVALGLDAAEEEKTKDDIDEQLKEQLGEDNFKVLDKILYEIFK